MVINLGTNDDLRSNPGYIASFNATYLELVLATSKRYTPRTHFFLAVGPLADTYLNETVWVRDQALARGVPASILDQRGLLVGGAVCCGHPGTKIDAVMAANGTATLRATMGW